MSGILEWLVNPAGLTPHGFRLLWKPDLIWLHTVSDLLIGLSYFSIPLVLARFALKRPDFGMGRVLWLFSIFIMACGTTHFLAVLTLFVPAYGLEGVVKGFTALASVATAVILWPLLPRALAIPAPATLQRLNVALQGEASAREEAVAQLRASEARYRTLYNQTPAAIHTMDERGCLVGVNDEWIRLLGYERSEVLNRPIDDLLEPGSVTERYSQQRTVIAAEVSDNLERRFRRADGTVMDALVSVRREADPSDDTRHFVGVVTDISGRKRAEAALHQAQKLEAIGRLTGGIAHDFNNMLTAIRGSLELLRPSMAQDARSTRLVDAALQAADRAASLTAQLLTVSRKQRLQPRVLAPRDVVTGMIELLTNTAGRRIALRVDVPADQKAACLADPNQLESALLNLVVNARNAIADDGLAEEGTITLSVRDAYVATAEVDRRGIDETVPPGRYVRIAVSDTGAGMTDEVRRQAFDPFFTTRPPGEGSGLGLPQIQGFVHQSGGHVRIASRVGQGTTVEILLPATSAAPRGDETGEFEDLPLARPGETVLVVDDEAMVRMVATEMLRGLGYNVLEASGAESALRLLEETPSLDALFTDVVMPGKLDGVGLAHEAGRRRPGLAVLMASGFNRGHERAEWPGSWGYLAKPYRPGLLARTMRETIDMMEASKETRLDPTL